MKLFTVTIIGAESTGKTSLSRQLADNVDGDWVPEFARPYLEVTDGITNISSMIAIWQGQLALQHVATQSPRPYVILDTDLYATVGYWKLPQSKSYLGACPEKLIEDAALYRSNLYLITQSNIPFEPDALRYGGDKRESTDEYWIRLCKSYQLPYHVISAANRDERLAEAIGIINERSAQ